eukprot:Tbor_TRINITY_DN5396_c0_g4::TRINITY_DN5396_c0_g4_i1::g.4627::m.4627/K17616/CTDSPL2; CTD small phosphatase-like protein 2
MKQRTMIPLRVSTDNNRFNTIQKSEQKNVIAKQSHNIARITHPQSVTPLVQRSLLRPVDTLPEKPLLTVIFDLDETLVSNRRSDLPHAILRPYVLHVLNAMRQMKGVEIVLWTASTKETGEPVVRQLEERGSIFDNIIYRDERWFTEPIHTKDLRLLGRDMNRVVVFDNAPNCVKLNVSNSVLIEDFNGVTEDRHDGSLVNLYYITDFLIANAARGHTVQDTLRQLAGEGQLCQEVELKLPESWRNANLSDISPLMIPPHGDYYRTIFTSAAPLDCWTI